MAQVYPWWLIFKRRIAYLIHFRARTAATRIWPVRFLSNEALEIGVDRNKLKRLAPANTVSYRSQSVPPSIRIHALSSFTPVALNAVYHILKSDPTARIRLSVSRPDDVQSSYRISSTLTIFALLPSLLNPMMCSIGWKMARSSKCIRLLFETRPSALTESGSLRTLLWPRTIFYLYTHT